MDLSKLSKIGEMISPEKKKELFLAVKIESEEIKSVFWTIEESEIRMVALGSREEWSGTKEELVVACDVSVSKAVALLPEEIRQIPHQLIFGLPYSWVENDKIKEEKLNDLHFVTNKLSFKPLGFVVIPEAISFYLKNFQKEIGPAILVYIGVNEISVSLVEKGKVVESEVVGRSDNLALDIEEGVLRFTSVKELPSVIYLYNNEDLETIKQTLLSYPWQPPSDSEGRPGFLHLPRIEILPPDFDINSVAFAGGEEVRKSRSVKDVLPQPEEIKDIKEFVLVKPGQDIEL